MSRLAHAIYGAKGFEAEKKALDKRIQAEIAEAKRIQRASGCGWSEALRVAASTPVKPAPPRGT
jgi:hypothetical protein